MLTDSRENEISLEEAINHYDAVFCLLEEANKNLISEFTNIASRYSQSKRINIQNRDLEVTRSVDRFIEKFKEALNRSCIITKKLESAVLVRINIESVSKLDSTLTKVCNLIIESLMKIISIAERNESDSNCIKKIVRVRNKLKSLQSKLDYVSNYDKTNTEQYSEELTSFDLIQEINKYATKFIPVKYS